MARALFWLLTGLVTVSIIGSLLLAIFLPCFAQADSGPPPFWCDLFMAKYDSGGDSTWTAREKEFHFFDGSPQDFLWETMRVHIALSGNGNILLAGFNYDESYSPGYSIFSFNQDGLLEWTAKKNQDPYSEYSGEGPTGMVIDNEGNAVVTGSLVSDSDSQLKFVTMTYDEDGQQIWSTESGGSEETKYYAKSLAIDSAGNLIVLGEISRADSNYQLTLVKIDANGNELWSATYDEQNEYNGIAVNTAADQDGNAIVVGNLNEKIVVVKYDPSGLQLWDAHYNEAVETPAVARDMTVDANGNIIVVGTMGSYNPDYPGYSWESSLTVKYEANGIRLWDVVTPGPTGEGETAKSVAVDASANIYVTGYAYRGALCPIVTKKMGPVGIELWRQESSLYNEFDFDSWPTHKIIVDSEGNAYVAAILIEDSTYELALIKYDSTGNEAWHSEFLPDTANDYYYCSGPDIALSSDGFAYLAGRECGTDPDYYDDDIDDDGSGEGDDYDDDIDDDGSGESDDGSGEGDDGHRIGCCG